MPDKIIQKDQLCIGLYIHLDLPWMKHPFLTSSFKIRAEKQLKTLRGLKLASLRFDPDKSDTQPLPPAETPAVEEPFQESAEDTLGEEKRKRIKVLRARRSKLNRLAGRYKKSVESTRKRNADWQLICFSEVRWFCLFLRPFTNAAAPPDTAGPLV